MVNNNQFYVSFLRLVLLLGLRLMVIFSWIKSYDAINQYVIELKSSNLSVSLEVNPIISSPYMANTLKTMARQMGVNGIDIAAINSYVALLKIYPNNNKIYQQILTQFKRP